MITSVLHIIFAVRSFIDAVKADKATLTPDVLSERFQEFLRVCNTWIPRFWSCRC